jgi:hypothetical protein
MATSFASLVADVMSLTKRPDLVNETSIAVRAATLKAHHSDMFFKDLFETGIQFTTAEVLQTMPIYELVPRFRSIKYIRKCDASTIPPTPLQFLEYIAPENALDSYKCQRANVYYMAGNVIQIRCIAAEDNFLFGAYLHPTATETGYNSWVANENPFAIIYEAVAIIFKTIGYDEQVSTYRAMVADEYAILKMANIVANAE